MSIEKERELFELWCTKDDEFCIHRYAGSDDYSDDYTQCAWMAWLSSANRESYKLVPVEPTQEMIYAGESAEHKGCISVAVVYKSMIGAIK